MPNLISNTMALIGGAAVGAAAMYLLDPDTGSDRRKDIAGAAGDAVDSTRQAVGTTATGASDSAHGVDHTIAKYAKGLSDHLSDRAGTVSDAVSDVASGAVGSAKSATSDGKTRLSEVIGSAIANLRAARDKVHDKVGDLADSAGEAVHATHAQAKKSASGAADTAKAYGAGWVDQAKSTRDDWLDAAHGYADKARAAGRKALGVPEPHPASTATGVAAGGIGVLAVGAALMYYMDPERGRSRRALLSDKVYSLTRHSGDKVRRYGHHLGNKAHGYVAEARHVVPEQWVDKAKSVLGGGTSSGDGTH